MTGATPRSGDSPPGWHRPFLVGFLVGAALIVPGVFLALLLPAAERVWPFVTPGRALLEPWSDVMAVWPGGLTMLLAAVLNGLVVGAAVTVVAQLVQRARRPGHDPGRTPGGVTGR